MIIVIIPIDYPRLVSSCPASYFCNCLYFHSSPSPISATDDVDLECESSIGNVFATILECEAEFDLVDIQCTIDGAALENCKLKLTLGN